MTSLKTVSKPVSQPCAVANSKSSGGTLDIIKLGRQNGRLAPLAIGQLCEYGNQTLEAFVLASCLCAKFNCPVNGQKFSLLATGHNCETGL